MKLFTLIIYQKNTKVNSKKAVDELKVTKIKQKSNISNKKLPIVVQNHSKCSFYVSREGWVSKISPHDMKF